jgi:hypothetical protein
MSYKGSAALPAPKEVHVRLSSLLCGLPLVAALALTARVAGAQPAPEESEYPVSFVERPLTLSHMTLAPELELEVARDPLGLGVTPVGIDIGATFGITRNWEVGATVLPLEFTPSVTFGSPYVPESNLQLFSTFRFLHAGAFEMGARLRAYFITTTGAGAEIVPSVPMIIHLGKFGRIDAEVAVPILARGTAGTTAGGASAGLSVPLSIAFDIIEPLHVGVSTGIQILDFSQASDTFFIPLGFFAGYAIGEKRPILDVDVSFQWTEFIAPLIATNADPAASGPSTFNGGSFTAGLSVKGYFYFW